MLTKMCWTAALVAVVTACATASEPRSALPAQSQGCGMQTRWLVTSYIVPPAGSSPALFRDAEVQEARAVMALMASGAELYCSHFGRYAESFDQVLRYSRTLDRLARCAVRTAPPPDPWGTKYRYRLVGGVPDLTSAGPDRRFGTPDDVGTPTSGSEDSEPVDVERICHVRPAGTGS